MKILLLLLGAPLVLAGFVTCFLFGGLVAGWVLAGAVLEYVSR